MRHACALVRGYVRLRTADPLDKPEIQTNYLAEQRDMDVLVEGVRRCRRIARCVPARAHRRAFAMNRQ